MSAVPYLLTINDLKAIQEIQTRCYSASMVESDAIMAARLAAASDWIWGIHDGVGLCAYLFCHPCHQGYLGPLHAAFAPAVDGNTLYLHDLAIHPRARGRKLAQILVHHAWNQALAAGLTHSALTAVQDSQIFWKQLGYQVQTALEPEQAARLADYPPPAHYMTMALSA